MAGEDFTIRGSIKFQTRDFHTAMAGVSSRFKDVRVEQKKTAVSSRELQFQTKQLTRELERQSRALGVLSLEFMALRNAMRTLGLRTAITGFASLLSTVGALGAGLVMLVQTAGQMSGALGVTGVSAVAGLGAAALVTSIALNGVGKALNTTGEEHVKAMDKLTRPARAFVVELLSLKTTMQEIRLQSQAGLFPGLVRGLKAAEPALGVIKDVLYDTAVTVGYLGERIGTLVGTRKDDLYKFGQRNVITLRRLGDTVINVASAFLTFMVAAGPLIGHVTAKMVKFSESLDATATAASRSGKLEAMFVRWRIAFDHLTSITGNFYRIFRAIFKGATSSTETFTAAIDRVTGKWADFLETTSSQSGIRKFFGDSNKILGAFAELIGAIVVSFAGLASEGADNAVRFFTVLREDILPVLVGMAANFNRTIFPALIDFIESVGDFAKSSAPALETFSRALAFLIRTMADAIGVVVDFTGGMAPLQGALVGLVIGAGLLAGWKKFSLLIAGSVLGLRRLLGLAPEMAVMAPLMSRLFSGGGRNDAAAQQVVGPGLTASGRPAAPGGRAGTSAALPPTQRAYGSAGAALIGRAGIWDPGRAGPTRLPNVNEGVGMVTSASRGTAFRRQNNLLAERQARNRVTSITGLMPVADITRRYLPRGPAWNQTRQRPGTSRRVTMRPRVESFPIGSSSVIPNARRQRPANARAYDSFREGGAVTSRTRKQAASDFGRGGGMAIKGLAASVSGGVGSGLRSGLAKAKPLGVAFFATSALSGVISGLTSGAPTIGGRFKDALAGVTFGLTESYAQGMEKAAARGGKALQAATANGGKLNLLGGDSSFLGKSVGIKGDLADIGKVLDTLKSKGDRFSLNLTKPGDQEKFDRIITALVKGGKISEESAAKFRSFGGAVSSAVSKIGPEAAKLEGALASGLDLGGLSANVVTDLDRIQGAFRDLSSGGGKNLSELRRTTQRNIQTINGILGKGTESGRLGLARNFRLAADAVRDQMRRGTVSTKTGTAQIRSYLIAALHELGIKRNAGDYLDGIDPTTGKPMSTGPNDPSRGMATGGMLSRLPGGVGPDSIPMNVNGRNIITAPGEDVAVFTRHQRAIVDRRLGDMGGLGGLFNKVSTAHNHPAPAGFIRGGEVVTASKYGGRDDPSAFGKKTASGAIANDSLRGFAELSNPPSSLNFAALGKLPMGTNLSITYNGRNTIAPKVDVGAGGPGLNGNIRAIDLAQGTATDLGFNDLADVIVGNAGQGAGGKLGAKLGAIADSFKAARIGSARGGLNGMFGAAVQGGLNRVRDAAQSKVDAMAAALNASGGMSTVAGEGAVGAMQAFASKMDALDIPYGPQGHASMAISRAGEDCSSSVSKVLAAGGALSSVQTTVGLPNFLESGRGKQVTIHDRTLPGAAGHTIMEIMGRFFGTSRSNPGGGPGWLGQQSPSYLASMPTKLHPKGLVSGGFVDNASTSGYVAQPSRGGGAPTVNLDDNVTGRHPVPKKKAKKKVKRVDGRIPPKLIKLKGSGKKAFVSSYAKKIAKYKTPLAGKDLIPAGMFTDYESEFERRIEALNNQLSNMQGAHSLTDEEPVVDLRDSVQFRDLTEWWKTHPDDFKNYGQDASQWSVVNKSGMTVQGKYVRGIDQHADELRQQMSLLIPNVQGRLAAGGGSIMGLLGLNNSVRKNEGGRAAAKAADDKAAVDMMKSFWTLEKLRNVDAAKQLFKAERGAITWQDRVANNDANIERLQKWKEQNKVKVAGDATSDVYKQRAARVAAQLGELRRSNKHLKDDKPPPTIRGKKLTKKQAAARAADIKRLRAAKSDSGQEMNYIAGTTDAWDTSGGIVSRFAQRYDAFNTIAVDNAERSKAIEQIELPAASLSAATLAKELGEWLGTSITLDLPTNDSSSAGDDAMKALLEQRNSQLAEDLRVSQAQFSVFNDFAPMVGQRLVGAFAHGGVVPETGMALVHKNETIIPDIDGPYRNRVAAANGHGGGGTSVELHLSGSAAALMKLVDARIDQKAPDVVSRALGRRKRLLKASAGGG